MNGLDVLSINSGNSLSTTDSDSTSQDINVKRFKPNVSAAPTQPFIDLTNDSDDFEEILSDTDDSDDDDDVEITGIRDLSRPNTNNNATLSNPSLQLQQQQQLNQNQGILPKAETGRLNGLNLNRNQSPFLINDNSKSTSTTSTTPNISTNSTTPQPVINHIKPEIKHQNIVKNQNPTKTAVAWNGMKFSHEADIANREFTLRSDLSILKKNAVQAKAATVQNNRELMRLEDVRKRLVSFGADPNSKDMIEVGAKRTRLLEKIKVDFKAAEFIENKVKIATKDLLSFVNQVKPKILATLNQIRSEEQRQIEIREAQARAMARPPHEALFGGMMGNNRHFLDMNDDDDDDDDDDDRLDRMADAILGGRNPMMNRNQLDPNSQFGMNIYNTDTTGDLRSFLESIKTLEDSKEGESNTPDDLTVNLLKHQRMGLHWLELNEQDEKKKGGILADAMGLGKTVQAISLMLSKRANDDDPRKTNLIVCPVAMMKQWESEIQTKIKEAANFKCFIFHQQSGSKRISSYSQLAKYDVVLVSYQTLASEMKKHIHGFDLSEMGIVRINAKKEANSYFSPFFAKESKFLRVILDEAQWIKNKLTKASIACSLLDSEYRWCLSGTPMQNNIGEIYPLIRFLRIRPYCFEENFKADILIPLKGKNENYDEFDRERAMKKVRILLRAILLRRTKDSQIDGEPILSLPPKVVTKDEIILDDNEAENIFYKHLEGKSALQVRELLKKGLAKGNYSNILTLLLRLRQACIHSELVRIGERKQGFVFDEEGNLKKKATWDMMYNYAKDLKPEVIRRINNAESTEDEANRFQCPICLDSPPDEEWTMFFPCGHGLCKECIEGFFDRFQEGETNGIRNAKCTQCRLQVKETQIISFPIFDDVCNQNKSKEVVRLVYEKKTKELAKLNEDIEKEIETLRLSPKFERALNLIEQIKTEHPEEKIILFSQFTTFFDLFQKFLNEKNIQALRYDGSMSSNARNDTIKEFYKDETKQLLMISLKAGNVGLTLTCANHVIIMDPFWNPYVEEQAQDRAHRIGQQKPVNVYRLLVRNTVEDRIMQLQDQKKELVESAMDEQGMKNAAGLGRREIEFLFNLH